MDDLTPIIISFLIFGKYKDHVYLLIPVRDNPPHWFLFDFTHTLVDGAEILLHLWFILQSLIWCIGCFDLLVSLSTFFEHSNW